MQKKIAGFMLWPVYRAVSTRVSRRHARVHALRVQPVKRCPQPELWHGLQPAQRRRSSCTVGPVGKPAAGCLPAFRRLDKPSPVSNRPHARNARASARDGQPGHIFPKIIISGKTRELRATGVRDIWFEPLQSTGIIWRNSSSYSGCGNPVVTLEPAFRAGSSNPKFVSVW